MKPLYFIWRLKNSKMQEGYSLNYKTIERQNNALQK